MKFSVKDDKIIEFLAGLAMLIAGVLIFSKNIYVASNFHSQGVKIGGIYLRSGICVIPLIAGLLWMFANPKQIWAKVLSVTGFALIILYAIFSVNIRVRYVSLGKWILILLLIIGGIALMCSAIYLKKKKK